MGNTTEEWQGQRAAVLVHTQTQGEVPDRPSVQTWEPHA